MSRREESRRVDKAVLSYLKRHGPSRWTDVIADCTAEIGKVAKVRNTIIALVKEGYVAHPVKRGPYEISPRGAKYLETLSNPSNLSEEF